MGLFDAVNTSQQTSTNAPLSPAEGIAGIALFLVASDGYISDDEALLLNASLTRMQLFRGYSRDVLSRIFDKVGRELKRRDYKEFLKLMAGAIPFEMAPSVFALVVDLAFADGEITEEEQAVIEYLYSVLDIPQDIAVQIIQVMQIKNKY